MKVQLDECAPRALKRVIESSAHVCVTVQDAGWAGKKNGDLLDLAEREFDIFVTIDTKLRYQQNLRSRRIAVVVLGASSNRLVDLAPLFPACIEALGKIKPGELVFVAARAN